MVGDGEQLGSSVSKSAADAASLSTAKLNAKEFNKRLLHLPIERRAPPPRPPPVSVPCLLNAPRWQQSLPFNPHHKMARRPGRVCVGRDIFLATSNASLLPFVVCALLVGCLLPERCLFAATKGLASRLDMAHKSKSRATAPCTSHTHTHTHECVPMCSASQLNGGIADNPLFSLTCL